ncbi:MAG: hypothetical protein WBH99_01315 [Azovibrio sp.]
MEITKRETGENTELEAFGQILTGVQSLSFFGPGVFALARWRVE